MSTCSLLPGFITFLRVCCPLCDLYYREVMVFVTGGATIISLLVLFTMLRTKIGEFKGKVLASYLIYNVTLIYISSF